MTAALQAIETSISPSSDEIRLLLVPPDKVIGIASAVWAYIQKAVDRGAGHCTVEDLLNSCVRNEMQLWVVMDGEPDPAEVRLAVVTEMTNTPQRRVFGINFLGGERMAEWKHLFPQMLQWSKEQGCVQAEFIGRRGWGRIWADLGFSEAATVFVKEF